ncbi:hypothetical protein PCYB_032040, partial [Plasmodium cynomolgi strain B]
MGIPRNSLKIAQSALKVKPTRRSCNPALVKHTARAAVYKKHKGMFKAAEKEIKREGKYLEEESYRTMEPRHFLQVFLVLVKHTFRDVSLVHRWCVELSGRNILSLLKYTCLYGYLHADVLIPLVKKAKNIFFEMLLDITLHECVEILSFLDSIKELEDKTAELRERIHFYEHQFGGTLMVTQYDVKCLVTLAQLSFDRLHVVPFLSVFLNNVHKFSGEDAARLVRLLLASWAAHTGEVACTEGGKHLREEVCTEGGNHLGEAPPPLYTSTCVRGLLSALLPSCPEIISQLTYTEMLILCGALDNNTLPNKNIIKRVATRTCDDLKKVDLPSKHLPPAYVDYLFLITFTLHKYEGYVNSNMVSFLIKTVMETKEEKLEKQIKEELLKLFLQLWVAYPIRSGRKYLDLLIVLNAFSQDSHVRSYLFSMHVVNRISRYIAFFTEKGNLTVHLCEDPVTKEPIC